MANQKAEGDTDKKKKDPKNDQLDTRFILIFHIRSAYDE